MRIRPKQIKLSKKDFDILKDMGYLEEDFNQIKDLEYKYFQVDKNLKEIQVSEKEVKKILSKQDFLSGIGRSAFHGTAFRRDVKSGIGILIESNLFNY